MSLDSCPCQTMEKSMFLTGATPPRNAATPQQPDTAARLLHAETRSAHTSPGHPMQKPSHTTLVAPPPPLACVSGKHQLLFDPRSTAMPSTTTGDGAADTRTPKRTAAAGPTVTTRGAAVPPLHPESLSVSSIASGSPSPLSAWSNKTERHQGPRAVAPQEGALRRGSVDSTGSAANSSQLTTQLLTLLPLPATSPSPLAVNVACSPAYSPKRCSRSSYAGVRCSDGDALHSAEGRVYVSTPAVSRLGCVSLNLDSAFLETEEEERDGGRALLRTPANVPPPTPEKRWAAPDLSPCTVSSTSVDGSLSPLPHHRHQNPVRGTTWPCTARCEENGSEEGYDETAGNSSPVHSRQRWRRDGEVGSTHAALHDTDRDSNDLRSDALVSSSGSGHRSLLPHVTATCGSPHPSAASPQLGVSHSISLSPMRARDFSAHYDLYHPPVHSPCQNDLQMPAVQATPSNTELLTDIFAEATTMATAALPAFRGCEAGTRGAAVAEEEDVSVALFSPLTSPDKQRLPPPSHSYHHLDTDASVVLHGAASPARGSCHHHTARSHLKASPSFGEADMGTQVFRSGTQLLSTLQQQQLQRHCLHPSSVPYESVASLTLQPFDHPLMCSRPGSTPRRYPKDDDSLSNLPHRTHHSSHRRVNRLQDILSGLHSHADAMDHSGLQTPRDVSAVAGGSGSASLASTPLFHSLSLTGPTAIGPQPPEAIISDMEHRADTPTSPHTPLDRRTPGPSGLHGSSYASLSEYSYGVGQHRLLRSQLSQPMTPQKSARRTYSRQTTPSQSFRSKVQSHSFESQQQLSHVRGIPQQPAAPAAAPFFSTQMSALYSAQSRANTSASSGMLGEITTTAERDYLAPSRNPFSIHRSLEVYISPLPQYSILSGQQESGGGEVSVQQQQQQHVLAEPQRRLVRDLSTAVLRPDAAVVLYEQLLPAPTRAPGSHRSRPRAPTPAQATLDLLLHLQPAHSRSLSLSQGGLSGRMWGGASGGPAPAKLAAPTAAAAAMERRDENTVSAAAGGFDSATSTPWRAPSLASAVGAARTIPHADPQRQGLSPPSSSTTAAATPTRRPRVALARCSPLHAPPGSLPRTPGRATRPTGFEVTAGTAVGVRLAASWQDVTGEPAAAAAASEAEAAAANTTIPSAASAVTLLCEGIEENTLGYSASSTPVAPARSLSMAFASSEEMARRHPCMLYNGDSFLKGPDDSATVSTEEGEDEEDFSPPPRRPVTQFDARNANTPLSLTDSPIRPERQLHFDPNDAEEDEEAQEKKATTPVPTPCRNTTHDASSPLVVMQAPLVGPNHELSTATGSSMGSPDFLHRTVANLNPLCDHLRSSRQVQLNLHDALRSNEHQERDSNDSAVAQSPSLSARDGPREPMQEALMSPEQLRPRLALQRQYAPLQEIPGLRLSMESNRVRLTNTNSSSVCCSAEVGSLLPPSTYEAAGSVLGALDTTVTSEEEENAGDRFQAHHEFQFLHYVDSAVEAATVGTRDATVASSSAAAAAQNGSRDAGRPIPLFVESNGVTWLATHRLNGLPYAVKEVPAAAFNLAELQCLTLSNARPHHTNSSTEAQQLTLQDLLEAEDYLARYHGVSTPPQDSTKPLMHLLQTEYFPRGSVHEAVCQRRAEMRTKTDAAVALTNRTQGPAVASIPLLTCAFWEAVVQQGLRGLRVLHRAHLVHGCPLPSSLFFTGHTSSQVQVKWSGFGSARARADVFPTESLPPWLSEAVALLYRQRPTVSAAVVEVSVFCLGVLELMVEEAVERDRLAVLPPCTAAAAGALCRLEWMEMMVCGLDGRHSTPSPTSPEAAALQRFMQFLWNTANGYHTAQEVLAQMCVDIDPALHTVEALYHYEIDRLSKQLQAREEAAQRRQEASCSSSSQLQVMRHLHHHHERYSSILSVDSAGPHQQTHSREAEEKSRSSSRRGSGRCLPAWSTTSTNGDGVAGVATVVFEPAAVEERRASSPHFFPRRVSTASFNASRVPRAIFLGVSSTEHDVSACTAGEGVCLFPPPTTAAVATLPAVPAVPLLSLSTAYSRSALETSTWGPPTTARRGRAEVHPRVRAAVHSMLLTALAPLPGEEEKEEKEEGGQSRMLRQVWAALLRPAVYSLRLRGWKSLYAGVPLSVMGMGPRETCQEEGEALHALLASLRPMTSFE